MSPALLVMTTSPQPASQGTNHHWSVPDRAELTTERPVLSLASCGCAPGGDRLRCPGRPGAKVPPPLRAFRVQGDP